MNRTIKALRQRKKLRVIGFDDAPFDKYNDKTVNIAGVVCANTRFEGMLWGQVEVDGLDASSQLVTLVQGSKFYEQLHAVILDGIAFGGFNLVDLPVIVDSLGIPVITVMRKRPSIPAIIQVLNKFSDADKRRRILQNAGTIMECNKFFFQAVGISENNAVQVLNQVTDVGFVPEALRLAHLIGSAIKTGQSSKRA